MSEWISIDKRLPKEQQRVLFNWTNNGLLQNVSMGFMCPSGWNIHLPFVSHGLGSSICPVTHWAEIPALPAENMSNAAAMTLLMHNLKKCAPDEVMEITKTFCQQIMGMVNK